ncbi:MAG: dihydrodipicolinate synthase family protein [Chloroflexota bacterium]|nr:dihydrodipicolinate synthase family protein [Chloroflexota bacterium]
MFRGIFPPTVTQYKDDGSLDTDANQKQHDLLIEGGVHGLFILATTGEFMHMNLKEREQHAADTVAHVAGRVPVIVGAGTTSTRETIRLSRHAQGVGADAVAIITPYFWTLSEREVIGHLSAVANAIDIPILVYNFPAYSNHNISSETLVALVREHRNIVGVMDAIDSLEHLRQRVQIVKAVSPDFRVLAGSDGHLLNILQLGGDGTVPSTANIAPERHVKVFNAYERRDYQQALELMPAVLSCLDMFRITGSFHSVVKEAMVMVGVASSSTPRQPALPLTADNRARLREVLARAQLLPANVES